jgi:hypothetical protein
MTTRFMPAHTASNSTQNTSEVRVAGAPAAGAKSARAYRPAAAITTAVVSSMMADRPSAASPMPSGGSQPPRW